MDHRFPVKQVILAVARAADTTPDQGVLLHAASTMARGLLSSPLRISVEDKRLMAVSTDRFRVTSVRPSASGQYEGVPEDLLETVRGKVLSAEDLERLGMEVKNARLYHGGDGIAVIDWNGEEFVLNLEPVESQ